MIRRVNLYSGPGAGKTTTSWDVAARLKNRSIHDNLNLEIDLVQEYVKNWAREGRKPTGFDQYYLCAKQLRREEINLRNGVDFIITDSPLLLQCSYAKKYDVPGWESLVDLVQHFEDKYPSIHIFLDRGDRPYINKGRYESHEQAKEMDDAIKNMLGIFAPDYTILPYNDLDGIENLIMSNIKGDLK